MSNRLYALLEEKNSHAVYNTCRASSRKTIVLSRGDNNAEGSIKKKKKKKWLQRHCSISQLTDAAKVIIVFKNSDLHLLTLEKVSKRWCVMSPNRLKV